MIRTLPILLGALVLSRSSHAQEVAENFENGITTLTNKCWQFNNVNYAQRSSNAAYVITGNGGLYSNPPVNNTNYRAIISPFLDITTSPIPISFTYKLSSVLKPGATRIIELGLLDKAGNFTFMDKVLLDGTDPATIHNYDGSKLPLVSPGIYKLVINLGGQTGDGNCRLVLDDLKIGASYHYATGCNPAPVAVDDNYTGVIGGTFGGSSVFMNDSDPDGEDLTATLVTNSPNGNVTLNPDGTFTFIPKTDFKDTVTSFTYKVTDNGYLPATSNTATVTIKFEKPAPIILNLVDFTGKLKNSNVQLDWEMGMNELVDRFEVQKSANGGEFVTAKSIKASSKTGTDKYNLNEKASASFLQYRLKVISKLGNEELSEIVSLSSKEAGSSTEPIALANNPVTSKLQFNYTASSHENLVITILNNSGVVAYTTEAVANTGINQYQINVVSSLKSGTYILSLTNQKGELYSVIFVKM